MVAEFSVSTDSKVVVPQNFEGHILIWIIRDKVKERRYYYDK